MAKEWQNKEGYADPTAYKAIQNVEREKRIRELTTVLKWIAKLAGFDIVGQIQLRDKKNGKIYR